LFFINTDYNIDVTKSIAKVKWASNDGSWWFAERWNCQKCI